MSGLCVVVPTYDEAGNLPGLVHEIERLMRGYDFRLIIVDDNSPDGTAEVAELLNGLYGNIVVRRRGGKFGLGSAVLEGLKLALEWDDTCLVVTLDGDFSHSPSEISRLVCAAEGADLVQGSRYAEGGSINGWGVTRRLVSFVANGLCRVLVGNSVHECTGNFRVYSRRCVEALVKDTRSKGFEWVVEAMVVARKYGFKVKEVPICFNDRLTGKTKLSFMGIAGWVFFVARTMLSSVWLPGRPMLCPVGFAVASHSKRVSHK